MLLHLISNKFIVKVGIAFNFLKEYDYDEYYNAYNDEQNEDDAAANSYEYEYEYVDDSPISIANPDPLLSEQSCQKYYNYDLTIGNLTECVSLDRCPVLFENQSSPLIGYCGFDEDRRLMMVCCPEDHVKETELTVQPRYPQSDGSARPVEDKTQLCERWKKNGACRLDTNFNLSSDTITSVEMFEFMMQACMDTCGWAGNKVTSENIAKAAWCQCQRLRCFLAPKGAQEVQMLLCQYVSLYNPIML